jgi:hypothetical protein
MMVMMMETVHKSLIGDAKIKDFSPNKKIFIPYEDFFATVLK